MSIVALTGATGFIGSRIAAELRARGRAVRALVRAGSRSVAHDCAVWDLESGGSADALTGVDVLVHAGAYVPANMADPAEAERCWRVNGLGTLRLVEAAVTAGVGHVVYVSSGNTYRPGPSPALESDPLYPSARAPYYLASKVCGELYVDHFEHAGKARVAIARPSAVFGPGMKGGLVSRFAERLKRGEPIQVADAGRYRADLVYVDDVALGIVAIVERRASGAFNLGSGVATSTLELATTLAGIARCDDALVEVEPPLAASNPGFAPLDVSRARLELAYAPRTLHAALAAFFALV